MMRRRNEGEETATAEQLAQQRRASLYSEQAAYDKAAFKADGRSGTARFVKRLLRDVPYGCGYEARALLVCAAHNKRLSQFVADAAECRRPTQIAGVSTKP